MVFYHGCDAVGVDSEENMLRHGGHDAINCNFHASACTVFEPYRHAEAARHKPVGLALGGPCADGAPGDHVAEILRSERLQELCSGRQTLGADVYQKLPSLGQALLHIVGAVKLRVVYEALPADSSARLLEVDPHGDHEPVFDLFGEPCQTPGVVETQFGVVGSSMARRLSATACLGRSVLPLSGADAGQSAPLSGPTEGNASNIQTVGPGA